MENIKFEINEQDIREYLKKYENDEAIKYKEAMFVKYMRANQEKITKESLVILMEKYNFKDSRVDGIYYIDNHRGLKSNNLFDFGSYLKSIKKLDISGICHILIPALGYYNASEFYNRIFYSIANGVVEKMKMNDIMFEFILKKAIEDYCISDLISINSEKHQKFTLKKINLMEKNRCEKELIEYSSIYGKTKVKQICDIVKGRM